MRRCATFATVARLHPVATWTADHDIPSPGMDPIPALQPAFSGLPTIAAQPWAPAPRTLQTGLSRRRPDQLGQFAGVSGPLRRDEQSHNLHALQVATGSCQVRLEAQGDESFAEVECR
jgi:hypothetical protein